MKTLIGSTYSRAFHSIPVVRGDRYAFTRPMFTRFADIKEPLTAARGVVVSLIRYIETTETRNDFARTS